LIMGTTYTPTATWHTTAALPADGDPGTAAAQNVPIEAALDNAAYLRARVPLLVTGLSTSYVDETTNTLGTTSSSTFGDAGAVTITGWDVAMFAGDQVSINITFGSQCAAATVHAARLAVSYDAGSTWTAILGNALRATGADYALSRGMTLNVQFTATTTAAHCQIRIEHKSSAAAASIVAPYTALMRIDRPVTF
jgi:hypothetical protein